MERKYKVTAIILAVCMLTTVVAGLVDASGAEDFLGVTRTYVSFAKPIMDEEVHFGDIVPITPVFPIEPDDPPLITPTHSPEEVLPDDGIPKGVGPENGGTADDVVDVQPTGNEGNNTEIHKNNKRHADTTFSANLSTEGIVNEDGNVVLGVFGKDCDSLSVISVKLNGTYAKSWSIAATPHSKVLTVKTDMEAGEYCKALITLACSVST